MTLGSPPELVLVPGKLYRAKKYLYLHKYPGSFRLFNEGSFFLFLYRAQDDKKEHNDLHFLTADGLVMYANFWKVNPVKYFEREL